MQGLTIFKLQMPPSSESLSNKQIQEKHQCPGESDAILCAQKGHQVGGKVGLERSLPALVIFPEVRPQMASIGDQGRDSFSSWL